MVLVALAAARGALDGLDIVNDDILLFSRAGLKLMSARWLEVFSDPNIQVGPLLLLPFGIVSRFATLLGGSDLVLITASVSAVFVLAFMVTVRLSQRMAIATFTPGFELFLGLVLILGGFTWSAATSGHPGEAFIPLLWIVAGMSAAQGRTGTAGAAIGVAAGMKLWALLGATILLISGRRVHWIPAGMLALAVGVVFYLPFLLSGEVSTFDYTWFVKPHSPVSLFLEPNSPFTWQMRLVQSIVICIFGVIATIFLRDREGAWWTLPMVVLLFRLLVDPLDYHYYWLPVGVIALIGVTSTMRQEPSWTRILIAGSYYSILVPFFVLSGWVLRTYIVALCLAGLVAIFRVKIQRVATNRGSA